MMHVDVGVLLQVTVALFSSLTERLGDICDCSGQIGFEGLVQGQLQLHVGLAEARDEMPILTVSVEAGYHE
jgi:hypothetical protein